VIRVLVADDHPFVLAGVAALLRSAGGIEVVGLCADGAEAVRLAEDTRPDVVLMDVDMPIMSGYEATETLRTSQPATRVLILSVSIVTGGGPENAYRAGAVGYLIKGNPRQVVEAIRTVAAGGTAWPSGFTPPAA